MQHGIGGRRLDQTSKSNLRAKMKPIAPHLRTLYGNHGKFYYGTAAKLPVGPGTSSR